MEERIFSKRSRQDWFAMSEQVGATPFEAGGTSGQRCQDCDLWWWYHKTRQQSDFERRSNEILVSKEFKAAWSKYMCSVRFSELRRMSLQEYKV
jgi:hypothetical protein